MPDEDINLPQYFICTFMNKRVFKQERENYKFRLIITELESKPIFPDYDA